MSLYDGMILYYYTYISYRTTTTTTTKKISSCARIMRTHDETLEFCLLEEIHAHNTKYDAHMRAHMRINSFPKEMKVFINKKSD